MTKRQPYPDAVPGVRVPRFVEASVLEGTTPRSVGTSAALSYPPNHRAGWPRFVQQHYCQPRQRRRCQAYVAPDLQSTPRILRRNRAGDSERGFPSLPQWKLLWAPSDDLPARSDLQYVGLGVNGRRYVIPHGQHNDFRCPGCPIGRPTGRHPEDPTPGPLPPPRRESVTVERVGEPDVVKQRRDVVKLVVEGDAVRCAVHSSPQVRADAVVQQRGRVETASHRKRSRGRRRLRKHGLSWHLGRVGAGLD
jgi:hypothetical protein